MIKKLVAFFVILNCCPFVSSLIAGETQQTPKNFNERLNQAYRTVLSNDPAQGIALFEELLAANSNEWLIYDAYSQALKLRGNFDHVRQVYEKALLSQIPVITPWRGEDIRHRIATLEQQKKFAGEMATAPSWQEAKVFGSQSFVVKTNIPDSYYYPVAQRIRDLIQKEKRLLEEIFGKSEKVLPLMNIYLFGRYPEYFDFMQAGLDERERRYPIYVRGYYDPERKIMAIYFDGTLDWEEIAHEMSHFLLKELYVDEPSRWLNEGLAQYISFEVEKDDSKTQIFGILEFLNWNYDQGALNGLDDFFHSWEKYEKEIFYNPFLLKHYLFYHLSWTLVHFFIEGGDSFYHDFFKHYLKVEQESGILTYASVKAYFDDNLSKEKLKELEDKWIKHTLNLTYDKV